jgi:hypothetical protein
MCLMSHGGQERFASRKILVKQPRSPRVRCIGGEAIDFSLL